MEQIQQIYVFELNIDCKTTVIVSYLCTSIAMIIFLSLYNRCNLISTESNLQAKLKFIECVQAAAFLKNVWVGAAGQSE